MNWRFERSSVSAGLKICFLSAGLAMVAPSQLIADQQDCTRAISRYDVALNSVQAAIGRFSACAASSAGRDNCSRELDHLKSAGDDYKDAVSDYRSDCK